MPQTEPFSIPPNFIAQAPCWVRIRNHIELFAAVDGPVLIQGPPGSGKSMIARLLHDWSNRTGHFVEVDCGVLSEHLLESELFGYERGAFTGAQGRQVGMAELAENGTLVIDEVHNIDHERQAKLLRLIAQRKFRRVGGRQEISTNTRIVAITNVNLRKEIHKGTFRKDLYDRFLYEITIPPLRDRREDLLAMVQHYLRVSPLNREGRIRLRMVDVAWAKLLNHSWEGNVRELMKVIEASLADLPKGALEVSTQDLADHLEKEVETSDAAPVQKLFLLPKPPAGTTETDDPFGYIGEWVRKAETEAVLEALKTAKGVGKVAARMLHIQYKRLLYKMAKYGLSVTEQREAMAIRPKRRRRKAVGS